MKTLARAIVTGFGLSVGAFLYKRIAAKLGLDDSQPKPADDLNARDGASDPSLQRPHHQPS
ncbi:MAG TPA: hypothetical protein VH143_29520 [Kofleriaceae bacterium]|jgi:hypothetical protein|nr:hypothetical protein [Kofleriaceae bacterium]